MDILEDDNISRNQTKVILWVHTHYYYTSYVKHNGNNFGRYLCCRRSSPLFINISVSIDLTTLYLKISLRKEKGKKIITKTRIELDRDVIQLSYNQLKYFYKREFKIAKYRQFSNSCNSPQMIWINLFHLTTGI